MPMNFEIFYVIEYHRYDNILGIAQTGDINAPLVPGNQTRLSLYSDFEKSCDGINMEVCNCDTWGIGDIFVCSGTDVMPMYFEIDKFNSYIDEILSGSHLHREGRFYPIGQLATVECINILYEQGNVWSALIAKVKKHPAELFTKWYEAQNSQIHDEEDLGRVLLRKEVLFYHQVLSNKINSTYQTLQALALG